MRNIGGKNEKISVLMNEFVGFVSKVEVLEKKREMEVEMNDFRREKECLVSDKVMFDEELKNLEVLSVSIKDEIEVLRRGLRDKTKEIGGKDEIIEELMRKVEVLEKEKKENEVKFDEIRRENENLMNEVKMGKSSFEIDLVTLEKEKREIEIKLEKIQRENKNLVSVKAGADELLNKERALGKIKLEEFKRKHENLVAKMTKSDEALRKEMDGKIKEMKERNDAMIQRLRRENEVKIQELNKKMEELEVEKSVIEIELEEFRRENERVVALNERAVEQLDKLEKEKIQSEIKLEKFCWDNEHLKALKAKSDETLKIFKEEMDGKIKEMKEKNDAETENLVRENEVKIQELKKQIECLEVEKSELMKDKEEVTTEKQVMKLKEDVTRLLLGNMSNRKKLMNDQIIEKVLSSITNVIDSEEDGGIDGVEQIQREVTTTSGFVTEVLRKTKRQRLLSQCSNQKNQTDDTSDESMNPSCNVKRVVDLLLQSPMAGSGSRSDQVVAPVREYEETSINVEKPLSNLMIDVDSSQHNACRPQLEEVIIPYRRNRKNTRH